MKHGHGKYVWNDGSMYEGEWFENKAHGNGKFTHSNNDVGNDYDSPSIAISYFEDELASIKVKSSAIIVNIDGIDIRIRDNITQLALGYNGFNTFVDPSNNTERFALFKPMYDDSDVYIVYNASTGLIQEIGYFSPT